MASTPVAIMKITATAIAAYSASEGIPVDGPGTVWTDVWTEV